MFSKLVWGNVWFQFLATVSGRKGTNFLLFGTILGWQEKLPSASCCMLLAAHLGLALGIHALCPGELVLVGGRL